MARIRLKGLTKQFGSVLAVDNVNLEIEDGELLALLGPSGCGKTTTLLMLAGIYRPTKGEIYFDNVVINDVPPKDRNVGLVFQSYALYPHMTVYDNIAFPLRLRRVDKNEIDRRVREVARLAQIEDLFARRPSQLSGGQQQRVALCRALVRKPALLLLDEPLSNLDARLRIETRTEIKRLQRELGITTILVTHDQVEAMTMAERVAVMRNGRIEQLSTSAGLYNGPANLFVASFIGDPPMNLIPMEYTIEGGKPCLVGDGELRITLPNPFQHSLSQASSRKVFLGIRPEHIRVSIEETDDAVGVSVFMTEPLGRDTLIQLQWGKHLLRALVPGDVEVQVGQKVWLQVARDAVHLFDAKTEQRLPDPKLMVKGRFIALACQKGA
ncbi:MAG TPA: ABC transporter ATP-binding protein [Firmicutes bacterium]|nr:ABC transporter ATP-binding protein [Bacillota bacterium]